MRDSCQEQLKYCVHILRSDRVAKGFEDASHHLVVEKQQILPGKIGHQACALKHSLNFYRDREVFPYFLS